ncbi:MAG: hypothetical protein LBL62_03620 [Planctomycetaceae bacterium]|nr:hypothetical protein [Planctomycetaceae bacterium]
MQSGLALPFQGEIYGGFNPPRCGGLLCNTPKGAGKTCNPTKILRKVCF